MAKTVFINRFFHPDISATSQILSDLAIGLVAQGEQVDVITSRLRYDNPTAELPAQETIQGVRVHRVASTRFGRDRAAGRLIDYLSFYVSSMWCAFWLLQRGDTLVAKTDPPLISVPPIGILKGICKVSECRCLAGEAGESRPNRRS